MQRKQTKVRRIAAEPARKAAPKPVRSRGKSTKEKWAERRAARRAAILAAALDEFAERGFEAARLEDVARRAGIAKGTIYLYFADKDTLFQELVRSAISPFVAALERARAADMPLRVVCENLIVLFVREVLGTKRKDLLRLILTEGHRFPKLAKFYYHEVPERALHAVRLLVKKGVARGELADDTLEKFPHLMIAPGLLAVMWQGLFGKIEPLDAEGMLRAHFHLLFKAIERRPS